MKINIIKLNFSTIGHEDNLHHSQIEFIKHFFKGTNIEISFNKNHQHDAVNFLFEGWSFWREKEVNNFLNQPGKFGIIFTESICRPMFLPNKFCTINNFFLKDNTIIKELYLIFLHYKVALFRKFYILFNKILLTQNYSEKKNFFQLKLFKVLNKILNFTNIIYNYNNSIFLHRIFFGFTGMFKEVFNITFKHINRFDYAINFGHDDDRSFLLKKNCFFFCLPFLYDKGFIKIRCANITAFNIKEYDFLFFGRITHKRKIILDKLKEKFPLSLIINSEVNFCSVKKLSSYIKKSKYIINLKQYQNQNFISSAKVFEGLNHDVPNIVEIGDDEKINPQILKNIIFRFDFSEIDNLKFYLDEYQENLIKFTKFKQEFIELSQNKKTHILNLIKKSY